MAQRWLNHAATVMTLAAAGSVQAQRTAPVPATSPAPASAPATAPAGAGAHLKDEALEKSIRQAVDFLLAQQADHTFETEHGDPTSHKLIDTPPGKGAETAATVYALLLAGQNIDDPRLKADSKELAPAIVWLTKFEPDTTLAASLQIAALSLVPATTKDVGPALTRAKNFLDVTTGIDGGHGIGRARSIDNHTLEEAWGEYIDAKYPHEQAADAALRFAQSKTRLEDVFRQARLMQGGIREELRALLKTIKTRDPKPAGAPQRMAVELREFNVVEQESNSISNPPSTEQDVLLLRKLKADLMQAKPQATPEGGTKLGDQMEVADQMLAKAEFEVKTRSRPQGDILDSAYASMGMMALINSGVDVRANTLQLEDRFWHLTQKADGTWGFFPDGDVLDKSQTGPATVAALASLIGLAQMGETDRPDKAIDKGLAWLDDNFSATTDNRPYLLNVERIGMALGRRTFHNTAWFEAGARQLIKSQRPDGSFRGNFMYASANLSTAYALAFLARGRYPLVFNKLEYKGAWNSRQRDGVNMAAYLAKKVDHGFAWQDVKLEDAAESWNESPILLIAGSRDPHFTGADLQKLKAFIQAGGMIVSTPDGNNQEFTIAMKAAANKIFDGQYEMKPVDEKAEVLSGLSAIKRPLSAFALSNGVRTVWVQADADWGNAWQRKTGGSADFYDAFANVYFYQTSMLNHTRLDTRAVDAPKQNAARSLAVARVRYAGNWDPEPGAWARFAKMARADFNTALEVKIVDLAALDAKVTPVAHLWGTGKVAFDEASAKALKKYVSEGGLLIVEAAGGDKEFAASAQTLLKKSLPGLPLEDLLSGDAIYKGDGHDAKKIDAVEYRPYLITKEGKSITPRLQGIKSGEKSMVIFSAEDISSGFLGTTTWGIAGYAPASSVALMRNILLPMAK